MEHQAANSGQGENLDRRRRQDKKGLSFKCLYCVRLGTQGQRVDLCGDICLCSVTLKALPFHFVSTQLVWDPVGEMKLAWAESCTVRKAPEGQYGELQYWSCASGSHFVMGPELGHRSGIWSCPLEPLRSLWSFRGLVELVRSPRKPRK